ncbi:hypothetical protein [Metabacillus fastidiosus]|uniref:hypothetical protein n=1 Tax=Metabacillus fastidiosus TaxID=1458 RepID=UPI003D2A018C
MKEGNQNIEFDTVCFKQYYHFLTLSDGARCGVIDLWSYNELPLHQFHASELTGGVEKWVEIGQVLYGPLVIEKNSGLIYYFHEYYSESMGENLGNFNYFMLNYVFGQKYGELLPDSHLEDWYSFLKRIDLI